MWKKNLKRSGIPQVQDRYAELLSQGDVQAQFRYYCAQYGDKIGLDAGRQSQGRTTTPATTTAPATSEDLFAAFQAFIASQAGATAVADLDDDLLEELNEDAELDEIEEPLHTTATRSTRATQRAAAPNADPFAPREPNAHATNGRLWKLNELGLLRVVKKPGDSITNGEAHAILKALL